MRRLTLAPLLLLVFVGSLVANETPASLTALQAGGYSMELTATEGSRSGGVVQGAITLVAASPKDTSPRNGQRAKDRPRGGPQFFGWVGADLAAVGAPLCPGDPNPSPDSQDPVYPGIVVIQVPYGPGGAFTGRSEVPALLVGTLSNLRDGSSWTDGCGFAMYLLAQDERCYTGQWSPWGLRRDGRGTFRLCPK